MYKKLIFVLSVKNLEKAKEELEASIHRSDTEIARLKAKSDSDQEYLETLKVTLLSWCIELLSE